MMNIGILILATCGWGALFYQALSIQSSDLAPWYFFGSGVFQWIAGVCFVEACEEFNLWRKSRD